MYMKFPMRYLPAQLSAKDKKKQAQMLLRSKRLYKKHEYYTRKPLSSYKNKTSKHIRNAQRIYKIQKINPSNELAKKTGCSLTTLNKIVRKGEGAYFSSGSRPNQTAQSWGIARLASSITAGKAAAVDYSILDKGCDHKKKAFLLANKSRKRYKYGHSKTRKVSV
jgi:DNA-binding Xre family transcriptional regulator